MAQAALQRVLDQLDTLEPRELEQVGRAVQERLAPPAAERQRQAFVEALLAAGLVRRLRTPRSVKDHERRLVLVEGKPVSETIIEERR